MSNQSIQKILRTKYRVEDGKKFKITDYDPSDTGGLSLTKKEAKKVLKKRVKRLSELQELLYANAQRTLIVALQGMDTSGKDGTIKHVTSGINPQGISVFSFKQPGPVELSHDYLWRIHMAVPQRGKIGIFNRSHYEEVLVTKIHPDILENQRLPKEIIEDKNFWQHRYDDICNFESFLHRQGFGLIKIFLNISKEEQRLRLLSRLNHTDKQWKFSPNDPKERNFWGDYQNAYQDAIANTATPHAPWFVVPANNKWYARLVVVEIMIAELEKFKIVAPQPNPEVLASMNSLKEELGANSDQKEKVLSPKKNDVIVKSASDTKEKIVAEKKSDAIAKSVKDLCDLFDKDKTEIRKLLRDFKIKKSQNNKYLWENLDDYHIVINKLKDHYDIKSIKNKNVKIDKTKDEKEEKKSKNNVKEDRKS